MDFDPFRPNFLGCYATGMRCMGLDLGTGVSGVAVIEGADLQGLRLTHEATLRAPKGSLPLRLTWMVEAIQTLLRERKPDVVALETAFYQKDVRALATLSQIRGAILVLLQQAGIPTIDCAPQAVKKAVTGQGHATKEQVARMLTHLLGVQEFSSADASDAAAVAYMGLLTCLHERKLQALCE